MRKKILVFILLLAALLLLDGCALKTVDQLYCLPKRSPAYNNLQSVIDEAMDDLEYCAPQSGDNRLVGQSADLDGDGLDEYLLFAKDDSEKPLKILIFCQLASGYVLMDTIEGYGFGFDFVSYQQLDDRPGVEIIVGRLVSEEVVRSVSVYRFSSGIARHMLSTAYSRMVVSDTDGDGTYGLFLLNQSTSEMENGTFSMYTYQNDQLQRTAEMDISCPAYSHKQITVSSLQDGVMAMYVTCAAENMLITDVFTVKNNQLLAVKQGLHTKMLDEQTVYPEDIDKDGVPEIPRLLPMVSIKEQKNELIEWYSLDSQGIETVKRHTYHNFVDNWYLELDDTIWDRLAANRDGTSCTFFIYDQKTAQMQPLYTIVALQDADREELALQPGRVVLYKNDSVIYVADITEIADDYGITANQLTTRFKTIRMDLQQEEN